MAGAAGLRTWSQIRVSATSYSGMRLDGVEWWNYGEGRSNAIRLPGSAGSGGYGRNSKCCSRLQIQLEMDMGKKKKNKGKEKEKCCGKGKKDSGKRCSNCPKG